MGRRGDTTPYGNWSNPFCWYERRPSSWYVNAPTCIMGSVFITALPEMPQIKNIGNPVLQDLLSHILAFDPADRFTLDEIS